MSREAWSNYYTLATKPCGDWQPGMQFPKLDKATRYLNAVNDELERRAAEKEGGCLEHNPAESKSLPMAEHKDLSEQLRIASSKACNQPQNAAHKEELDRG